MSPFLSENSADHQPVAGARTCGVSKGPIGAGSLRNPERRLVEKHLPHRIRSRDRDQLVSRGPAVVLQQSAESLRAFDIARPPVLDPFDPLVIQLWLPETPSAVSVHQDGPCEVYSGTDSD